MKTLVKRVLATAGLEIRRLPRRRNGRAVDPTHPAANDVLGGAPFTLRAALEAVRKTELGTIIDIGASNGQWSEVAMDYFPNASYLLIEANKSAHEASLAKFKAEHPNVDYVAMAAGNRTGLASFHASDPWSGLVFDRSGPQPEAPGAEPNLYAVGLGGFESVASEEVPVAPVDELVAQRRLPPPYLIKVDTHGYEQPILEGAAETLKQTALLIVEAYNFQLQRGSMRFHELCAYLEGKGFRCLDIFDLMRRPRDCAFWQMDMLFAPRNRPELLYPHYS